MEDRRCKAKLDLSKSEKKKEKKDSPSEAPAMLRNMKVGFVSSTRTELKRSRRLIPKPASIGGRGSVPPYASETLSARIRAAPEITSLWSVLYRDAT